jgi:hypothetical protein
MMGPTIDESRSRAARTAGLAYLLAIPPAVFAEFFVFGRLVVPGDAARTFGNISVRQELFRLGVASNLAVFAIDVILITSLYLVLKSVDGKLALAALLFRSIESVVLVVMTLNDFHVLRMISGGAYLRAFDANALQAMALLSWGGHKDGYDLGLAFCGIGGTLFCWLWVKSAYVPGSLARFGLLSSFLLGTATATFVLLPDLERTVSVVFYGGPIFIFELTMGFWLLVKGIRSSSPSG